MGIAILAAARLVQVVPGWIGGFVPRVRASNERERAARAHTGRDQSAAGWHSMSRLAGDLLGRLTRRRQAPDAPSSLHTVSSTARPRPLRVLRVLDPHQPRAAAGRMVISGRMADVCAELDRLAAAEAAHQK